MKQLRTLIFGLAIASFAIHTPPALAQLDDIFKSVKEAIGLGDELSESRIIEGLKEALEIGTGNAVNLVSILDGYYKNPRIRIPLPDSVKRVEKVLRTVGYGSKVDAFELSMNRAAEQAAPEAKALFIDTIKQMSFADARKILNGRENEATLYFKDKTWNRLGERFKPPVHSAMSKVGVTQSYQELEKKVQERTEELKDKTEKLVQTERLAATGKIANRVAHELRNPLTVVGGFARRLNEKISDDDPNKEYLDIILREVKVLETKVSEIIKLEEDEE